MKKTEETVEEALTEHYRRSGQRHPSTPRLQLQAAERFQRIAPQLIRIIDAYIKMDWPPSLPLEEMHPAIAYSNIRLDSDPDDADNLDRRAPTKLRIRNSDALHAVVLHPSGLVRDLHKNPGGRIYEVTIVAKTGGEIVRRVFELASVFNWQGDGWARHPQPRELDEKYLWPDFYVKVVSLDEYLGIVGPASGPA